MKAFPLLILGSVLATTSVAAADSAPSAAGLDKPDKILHQPLGGGAGAKDAKLGTSCFYYSGFMVKQVDLGEEGAEQLSILPVAAAGKAPPCQRKNLPGERVFPPEEWGGYFRGVQGDYVLLDAADGVNGGLGFAVVATTTGRKIFEDVALKNFQQVTLDGGTLKLRYTRSFAGSCSVPAEGEACWRKIESEAGLTQGRVPDCAGGYRQGKIELAKGRCQAKTHPDGKCFETEMKGVEDQHFDESPSVVDYPVETEIDAGHQAIHALSGPNSCRAAD
jgi:hypothetical protein